MFICPLRLFFGVLGLLVTSHLFANNNLRHWELVDGRRIHAELVDYNEAEDSVYLRLNEKEDSYWKLEDFSPIDQAWLVEWLEFGERLEARLAELPGRFTHYNYWGEHFNYDFYVYEPSKLMDTPNRPLMLLLSAGPKGMRYLLRHADAAEASGMTIVTLDHFGNTHTGEESKIQWTRLKEIFPQIEATVPHDPMQLYAGGISGGTLRAIKMTNRIDRPWAGIFWNGGWLGYQKYMDESYRPMKVIIVNGNNDYANAILKRDLPILRANGAQVGIIAFEGGHQIPPVEHQTKAFHWLLEDPSITELSSEADLLQKDRGKLE